MAAVPDDIPPPVDLDGAPLATAPPIAAVPDPEPAPEPEPALESDGIDLNDLVDAPAHTEQMIEKVTEAFPGAEVHVPEETPE